ncbi:MAG: HDOD domain-containing protein [Proteobacteria bacterium]|nr:HDOD domain-containing protein [Pseudomonadota bacterium]
MSDSIASLAASVYLHKRAKNQYSFKETELRRELVFSGNYVVSNKKELVLEACLGTCIGVTICDKEAKVGGLIHLLLPEWTGYSKNRKPGLYAKTGLPIFISALYAAGADKSRMEACVAGGSLVGPVSEMDIDLDIGGRTAEIVREILEKESIAVRQSETGGFFGYRLSLDLKSFNTSINLTADRPAERSKEFRKPTPDDIQRSIRMIRPIPQIALKIIRMMNVGNYNMNEVAGEIKKDQIITAAVIRLCNSSYFGLREKIDSINRALILIGEKHLFKMIVSASLEQSFSNVEHGYSLCKGGLFQHSLGTAVVSEELARFTGVVQPEIAYTAGLLHDIGKVVLDQYISSIYTFFYRRTQIDMVEIVEAEKETLGFTHTEAGSLLGESWSLNDRLIDTIRHHHHPEHASVDPELTHVVYLADLLMSKFQAGHELQCLNNGNITLRLKKIGLIPSQFSTIVDLIPHKILEGAINLHGMR